MADKMNFGPEWLRNLSSEGESSGPKYQLAEFRYGREEMLILFDKNIKPPENLSRFQDLFVEKIQTPVSLLPMTEEETKLWNRGISTDMVLRPGGKAPPPGLAGAALRGRGGSIDRGRGRGKTFFYSRTPYDEGEPGKEQQGPFLRSSRSFDRTQMNDRGWSERNGGDPTDWNGSTSPRKEYGGLGRVNQDHNWRKHRGGGVHAPEEEDGWRQREKWQRSSWRDENADPEKPASGQGGGRSSNWGRGWADDGTRNRGDSDYDSKIPEWANADHHEPSGSFDASGAFHAGSDEEDPQPKGHGDGGGNSKHADHPPAEPVPIPVKEKTASSAALSDAQSLDRIRAQHQNFVTKAEPKEPPPPSIAEKFDKIDEKPSVVVKPMLVAPSIADLAKKEPKRQRSEDDMTRLAVDSVVKLIEEDARPFTTRDVWYYRDPSGTEQGPFPSADMHHWFSIGFFQESLLVRRENETGFTPLGQLMMSNNRPPFFPMPIPTTENFPYLLGQSPQQSTVKLPEREHWQTLPDAEREAILRQKLAISQLSGMDVWNKLCPQLPQANVPPQNVIDPNLADPVRTLLMMSAQAQAQGQTSQHVSHNQVHPMSHNVHNMNSVLPGVGPTDMQQGDALNLLIKQEQAKAQRRHMDSLWSGPGRPAWTNGLENVPSRAPPMPWEEEIFLDQQKKMHQRLIEEQRKVTEELMKKKEDDERIERDRKDMEDRRRKEEEGLRAMLRLSRNDPLNHEPGYSDLGAGLPDRKREEESRKRLEEQRRKLEEMKRLEEAQKKKEEKDRKKEEERAKKRLAEEEKMRQETEKERIEREILEARKLEELAMEQQRRQEDALRLLKEQHLKNRVKPWSQNAMPQASLADIQAQERERKLQQQRDQQALLAQILSVNQSPDPPKDKMKPNLNLKWASQSPKIDQVKSLAEIQAEEQIQLAKQIEKDRIERQHQQREMNVNTGIWGSGSGLTWTNQNNSGPWGGVPQNPIPTAGFWDTVAPTNKNTIPNKQSSPVKMKPQGTNGTKKTVATNNTKTGKPKSKREEAAVLKLFETQDDEFSNWCSDTLHSLDAGIDVPTFSSFLRDVESPSDVKEYVKTYLGEKREAIEFAKNFLERRSRMRAASRAAQYEDDMCAPAAAINPGAGQDSQDSSKKGKKAKKNKMVKVDTAILGFNVTAAQNRINVGERDTWEPDS